MSPRRILHITSQLLIRLMTRPGQEFLQWRLSSLTRISRQDFPRKLHALHHGVEVIPPIPRASLKVIEGNVRRIAGVVGDEFDSPSAVLRVRLKDWPGPGVWEAATDGRVAEEVACKVTRSAGDDEIVVWGQRVCGSHWDGYGSAVCGVFGRVCAGRVPCLQAWVGAVDAGRTTLEDGVCFGVVDDDGVFVAVL